VEHLNENQFCRVSAPERFVEVRVMKTYSEEQFLKWAEEHGVIVDERYPGSAELTFTSGSDLSRFWIVPSQPKKRPRFLAAMLRLLGKWHSCRVWRHMGRWPERPGRRCASDRVELQILKGIGMPMGTDDVVEFMRTDRDRLTALLFTTTVFGWSVAEDLYLVPNDAQYIVETSHHGLVYVYFRQLEDLHQFVEGMNRAEFPLPDTVPDWTIEIPDWMTKP
jgi:hypothetical protein